MCSGKYDRCHLGEWGQTQLQKSMTDELEKAVATMRNDKVAKEDGGERLQAQKFVQQCIRWLQADSLPDAEQLSLEFCKASRLSPWLKQLMNICVASMSNTVLSSSGMKKRG